MLLAARAHARPHYLLVSSLLHLALLLLLFTCSLPPLPCPALPSLLPCLLLPCSPALLAHFLSCPAPLPCLALLSCPALPFCPLACPALLPCLLTSSPALPCPALPSLLPSLLPCSPALLSCPACSLPPLPCSQALPCALCCPALLPCSLLSSPALPCPGCPALSPALRADACWHEPISLDRHLGPLEVRHRHAPTFQAQLRNIELPAPADHLLQPSFGCMEK